MGAAVPYVKKDVIEAEAALVLSEYGQQFGPITAPPIPIDDIVELHLRLTLEILDLRQIFGFGDVHGAIWFRSQRVGVDQSLDPAWASLENFLDRVVSRAAAMLLRSRKRRKRAGGLQPLSLESDFTSTGEGLKPLSDTVSSDDVARRLGTQSVDPIARLEQTEAVESALARMPERLRDICQRLMTGTVASVARQLGISRHQVRKAVEDARPYFEEAGLENG